MTLKTLCIAPSRANPALQTRSFAAVLFRRIASKTRKDPNSADTKELFLTLVQDQKVAIRQKLVYCLNNEQLPHVRNKIGDAVAEIARQYTDNGMSSRVEDEFTLRRALLTVLQESNGQSFWECYFRPVNPPIQGNEKRHFESSERLLVSSKSNMKTLLWESLQGASRTRTCR